jgi:hypothetical protein
VTSLVPSPAGGRHSIAHGAPRGGNACLAGLRGDKLGVAEARAVAREMVAFAAMRDELERGGELLLDERSKGVSSHAA